jgi:hypothetical protein
MVGPIVGRHARRRRHRAVSGSGRLITLIAAMLALAACASSPPTPSVAGRGLIGPTEGESAAVECAPFARALSGVQLYGKAADWWWKADGLYVRSSTPAVGGVLVLRRSARLAHGHVGVVSAREIRVTQANWVRHRVYADMPVVDLSADNDWTLVRVWWPPAGQMGRPPIPLTASSSPTGRGPATPSSPPRPRQFGSRAAAGSHLGLIRPLRAVMPPGSGGRSLEARRSVPMIKDESRRAACSLCLPNRKSGEPTPKRKTRSGHAIETARRRGGRRRTPRHWR